nr:hypothetical protein [uncultured Actinotalea sp.]
MKSRRRSTLILAGALLTPTLLLGASPAQAASCIQSEFRSYAYDYARTTDASGGCAIVRVRHFYDPVWSGTNYWTSWYSGGDVATTPRTAELVTSDHNL